MRLTYRPDLQENRARHLEPVVNEFNRSGDQSIVASGKYLEVIATKC
jgi:hypothetical protein